VVVVPHQAVAVAEPAVPIDYPPEQFEEVLPIDVVPVDRLARIAADDDVVGGTRVADAVRTRDQARLDADRRLGYGPDRVDTVSLLGLGGLS
jgi:hypothetical protein